MDLFKLNTGELDGWEPEADREPTEESVWRHHSGRYYQVLFLTNEHDRSDYPRTVVYQGLENGKKWSGPLEDWHRRMTFVSIINPMDYPAEVTE